MVTEDPKEDDVSVVIQLVVLNEIRVGSALVELDVLVEEINEFFAYLKLVLEFHQLRLVELYIIYEEGLVVYLFFCENDALWSFLVFQFFYFFQFL